MRRRLKKHRTALVALAVYNIVVFFPVLFMGRVLSPNDVFFNFDPWNLMRPADVQQAQNSLLNDPPTAYFTLMSMVKDDWRTFHWNPYVGSGIPGWGSSAAAVLSPFILLPALLIPQAWVFTAIVFLKLNLSYLFAYLWLREEKLGRRGAALGAIVIAGAGVYAVRWLWQITNATALYPALLWIVRRTFQGKRTPVALIALVALSYALAGFPAAMAYGAWVIGVYAALLFFSNVRAAWKPALRCAFGVALALLIALPTLVPFVQLLKRSGYLEARQGTAIEATYPKSHWMSFLQRDRLGNPAYKDWRGDHSLRFLNNYVETTIYLGLLTIPLALFGVFNKRARMRSFWLAIAVFVLGCMFGAPLLAPLAAKLPGFKYSALARVGLLLPLPVGYFVAAARLRRGLLFDAAAVILAFDLALLAGRFHPYLTFEQARVPQTPTTEFLRRDREPFRIAPFFNYLWPNSAEYVRVEDVRSHFGSEGAYRRMLMRLDPSVWGGSSTVLTFNSLQFNFDDPLTGLLGIRWYVEPKSIDIIKWGIFKATKPGVKEISGLPYEPGSITQRTVRIDAEPFWAIEVPVGIEQERGAIPHLEFTLMRDGNVLWTRNFTKRDTDVMGKLYVPVRPYARLGDVLTLRIRSVGASGRFLSGANDNPNEAPLFYGRVTTPVIFDRELPDGRLFRNLAEVPRFRGVSKLRKLNDDEFLAARDVDFAAEAVITDDPVMPPELTPTNEAVTMTKYSPDEQRITTSADAPFFLASSEKLTPELRITIDGKNARAIESDMIFAGVVVPEGRHEVVFSRRIARGWWWAAVVGLAGWLLAVIVERRSLFFRRR
ncbi:MAG TPA: hypothetical protein VHW00_08725 [Thermoanaerobaculia bacterium]|nr:hypothetical protein [Thermoanaerobaculia bacterium]